MIYLRWNLGLGDAIICNALVRRLAQTDVVLIPVRQRNFATVAFMFRDCSRIICIPLATEALADSLADKLRVNYMLAGAIGSGLGFYCNPPFDRFTFDQEFYRQAGVPFQARWDEFHCDVDGKVNWCVERGQGTFVHDDAARGFSIPNDEVRQHPIVRPDKSRRVIFDWLDEIAAAEEIHCIDSSFACMIDSFPQLRDKLKFIHRRARPNAEYPTYQNNWTILK